MDKDMDNNMNNNMRNNMPTYNCQPVINITNHCVPKMGTEISTNQANQLLNRVTSSEERTDHLEQRSDELEARLKERESNFTAMSERIKKLEEQGKKMKEEIMRMRAQEPESKENQDNCGINQGRQPVEHCEYSHDYVNLESAIPGTSGTFNHQSLDYQNVQSVKHQDTRLIMENRERTSNSSLATRSYDDALSQTRPKVLVQEQTDLSQTRPKVLVQQQTDLSQTQPKVLVQEQTDLSQTRPKVLVQEQTDLSQTRPKVLVQEQTDLSQTRPKVPEITRTDNRTHTDPDNRTKNRTKYPPIPKKPETMRNQPKQKPNNSLIDPNTKQTGTGQICVKTPTKNLGASNSETKPKVVGSSNEKKEDEAWSVTKEITLTIFALFGGYYNITVPNDISISDLEKKISQEIGRKITVHYIYSKMYRKWLYSHQEKDDSYSCQSMLVTNNDIVLC